MTYFRVVFNNGACDYLFESADYLSNYIIGDVMREDVQDIYLETIDLNDVADAYVRQAV